MNELLALGRTLRGIVEGESVPDVFVPRLIDRAAAGAEPGKVRQAGAADGFRGLAER